MRSKILFLATVFVAFSSFAQENSKEFKIRTVGFYNLENLFDTVDDKEKNNLDNTTEKLENPKCLLILKKGQKISRNDRCEATGKKFKNCCGAL